MKTCASCLLSLALLMCAGFATTGLAEDDQLLSIEDLEVLVAPYALYPDSLLAQILPAATFPLEVHIASRWVRAHPDLAGLEEQPLNPEVKAVARIPEIINMMDDNIESTIALGNAFVNQQADLMDAVQRLRAQSKDDGSLADTPEQSVVVVNNIIVIMPCRPWWIHVPHYHPHLFFGANGLIFSAGQITFGPEIIVNTWLDMDFDWVGHHVYFGHHDQPGKWTGHGEKIWTHPHFEPTPYHLDFKQMKTVTVSNVENRNLNIHRNENIAVKNGSGITYKGPVVETHKPAVMAKTPEKTPEIEVFKPQANKLSIAAKEPEVEFHKPSITYKAPEVGTYKPSAAPATPAYRNVESEAFRVGNGAAEREASVRGATSLSSAGTSWSGSSSGNWSGGSSSGASTFGPSSARGR